MRQKIKIANGFAEDQTVILEAENKIPEGLSPASRVLADSDNAAFIYILDSEEGFSYVVLHEELWPLLKEALTSKMEVKLTDGETTFVLEDFQEEMNELLTNIQGNANYGTDMVNLVEGVFLQ